MPPPGKQPANLRQDEGGCRKDESADYPDDDNGRLKHHSQKRDCLSPKAAADVDIGEDAADLLASCRGGDIFPAINQETGAGREPTKSRIDQGLRSPRKQRPEYQAHENDSHRQFPPLSRRRIVF